MQFDNLSSEFLKILSPQNLAVNLDAIKLEAFARQLTQGQTLTGQVAQVLSQGRALVNFEGTQVLVELGRSVLPREVLTVQVDRTQPSPVLKLLSSTPPAGSLDEAGPNRPASPSNIASSPTRQDGVITTLSTSGIRREQAFSLRALEHGVRQIFGGNPLPATEAKVTLTEKLPGPVPGTAKGGPESTSINKSPSQQLGEAGSQISRNVPAATGEAASSSVRENRNTQGDVARFSRPLEFKVADDQFLSRQGLDQLKLEPNSQIRLDVLRVTDSQTLLARTPTGIVAVKTVHAGIFKPGDPVIASVQTHQGKPFLEGIARDQIIQPVTTSMIKPVFPQRQPIGAIAADLEQNVLGAPALKDIPLDAKLIARIQQTIHVLKTPAPEALSESRVQELVNRSGVNYEPQVRNLLLEGDHPDTRIQLEQDLKGQVLELVRKLDDHIKKMSLPEPILRQVSDMVQNVQRTIQGIEYHQLNQQFSRQENLPVLLQVPSHLLGNEEHIQIYVRRDFEEGAGQDSDPREQYKLVFLLDLSALGSLRIDTQIREEGLSIHINSEDPQVIQFINSRSGALEDSLKEMGFSADILGRVQEKIEMEMPDVIAERMVYDPTRLVDIET